MYSRTFANQPRSITPCNKRPIIFDASFSGANTPTKNTLQRFNPENKKSVRRALQEKFKDIYEGTYMKKIYSKHLSQVDNNKKNNISLDLKLNTENISKKYDPLRIIQCNIRSYTPVNNRQRRWKTMLLDECSECSVTHNKGKEYICIDCSNKEMAINKKKSSKIEYPITKTIAETWKQYKKEIDGFTMRVKRQKQRALNESKQKNIPEKIKVYFCL